jgi:hypothetical protein
VSVVTLVNAVHGFVEEIIRIRLRQIACNPVGSSGPCAAAIQTGPASCESVHSRICPVEPFATALQHAAASEQREPRCDVLQPTDHTQSFSLLSARASSRSVGSAGGRMRRRRRPKHFAGPRDKASRHASPTGSGCPHRTEENGRSDWRPAVSRTHPSATGCLGASHLRATDGTDLRRLPRRRAVSGTHAVWPEFKLTGYATGKWTMPFAVIAVGTYAKLASTTDAANGTPQEIYARDGSALLATSGSLFIAGKMTSHIGATSDLRPQASVTACRRGTI